MAPGWLSRFGTNVEEHLFYKVHEQGQVEGPRLLDPGLRDTSHRFGHLRDRTTVLDGYREVDARFLLANLHRDAASLAGATANAVEDSADGAGGATHMYRFDLLGRDACNLGDDGDAYGRVAVLGYVCLVTFVLAI